MNVERIDVEVDNNVHAENDYYKFGYQKFGPLLYGFTKWLSESLKKEEIDNILFLSRDGYMMKRAYEALGYSEKGIKTSYFYCSRKSLRTALIWECDSYKHIIKYMNKTKNVTLRNMLELFGFDELTNSKISADYGVDLDYYIPYEKISSCELFVQIFEDFKEQIRGNSNEQRELLLEYLKNNIDGKICGIVDIGWHGSLQYYLEKFVEQNKLDISFVGFYVGISPFYKNNGRMNGYLFDNCRDRNHKKVLCSRGLLERLFQSQEGSTVAYKRDGSRIGIVNDLYEYDKECLIMTCISELQNGAISYIVDNQNHYMVCDDMREFAKQYINFGMNPSNRDLELFKFLYNTDGCKSYYISNKPLYKYKFKELCYELNSSPWKTGFMKSLFKIPFPYFWIYKIISK